MKTEIVKLRKLIENYQCVRRAVSDATVRGRDGVPDEGLPFMREKMDRLERRINKMDPELLSRMA